VGKAGGVKLTTQLHLVLRLRLHGMLLYVHSTFTVKTDYRTRESHKVLYYSRTEGKSEGKCKVVPVLN
jgi:hypothetical protein